MDLSPGTSIVVEPPRATTRTTVPVPVRSKQRASSTEDPQPKKKQKSMSAPESTATVKCGRPVPLPIISKIPHEGFNSDDSDDDAASGAASTHDHPDTNLKYSTTVPPNTTSTTPPGTSTPLTLTPNPNATIRILQPNPADPPRDPPYRPWTQSPVLRGRRSELDFVVIRRCANWDGESWSKRTNMVAFTRLMNQRLRTKRHWHSIQEEKVCTCCLPAFSFVFPLSFLALIFLFFSSLLLLLPLFSSLLLSSSPYRLHVVLGCSFSSKYGSLIRLRTHCPRSLPLTGRTHGAAS